MRYLIIGGVAGGATTAARIRREDEKGEIILFERGEFISYANCGLPYYIGGKIKKRENLLVQSVSDFSNRYDIDIRTFSEILSIDTTTKSVTVKNRSTGKIYNENYDKLLLSPGAEPFRPQIPGIDDSRILTLRNIPDTDRIKEKISNQTIKRAVIAGGGFIGLEMAENLRHSGIDVTIIEMAPQVMAPLDPVMASIVHHELLSNGVKLLLNESVSAFDTKGDTLKVILKSGKEVQTDIVIWSIGVKPETRLAQEAGLKIGPAGGISVNEYLQTSDGSIYATGDAIEVINPNTGQPAVIPLAGPANKQARIAADNMVHDNISRYKGTIGTGIAKIFKLTAATTGANERTLQRFGIDYLTSITHSGSHAGYYPGAKPLSVKILYSPVTGKLLGGQVVGYGGVDKRIDTIATIIGLGGSIHDLTEIEHAYAPPFSSAKDPVNMAGFVADNILKGKLRVVTWEEADNFNPERDFLLDVRSKQECVHEMINGAVNIPLEDLRFRLDEIPTDKRIIIYCAVGMRGYLAYRILSQNDYQEVFNLSGGYLSYFYAKTDQNNRLS
ncbi:MAG: FAD-dependent oxidoreductase [Rikenellaceae bacterium]|nr:FAD-dependent oxidoreductase [Rikenellaceae bacterium]